MSADDPLRDSRALVNLAIDELAGGRPTDLSTWLNKRPPRDVFYDYAAIHRWRKGGKVPYPVVIKLLSGLGWLNSARVMPSGSESGLLKTTEDLSVAVESLRREVRAALNLREDERAAN